MTDTLQHEPWAQLLTLGDARFGILAGGPFDGRCYPLSEGPVPAELDVPGPQGRSNRSIVRYVLRDAALPLRRRRAPSRAPPPETDVPYTAGQPSSFCSPRGGRPDQRR